MKFMKMCALLLSLCMLLTTLPMAAITEDNTLDIQEEASSSGTNTTDGDETLGFDDEEELQLSESGSAESGTPNNENSIDLSAMNGEAGSPSSEGGQDLNSLIDGTVDLMLDEDPGMSGGYYYAKIIGDSAPVYLSPSDTSPAYKLSAGSIVLIVGVDDIFAKIAFNIENGIITGCVSSSSLVALTMKENNAYLKEAATSKDVVLYENDSNWPLIKASISSVLSVSKNQFSANIPSVFNRILVFNQNCGNAAEGYNDGQQDCRMLELATGSSQNWMGYWYSGQPTDTNSGCGIYAMAHAYQWLTGDKRTASNAADLLRMFINNNIAGGSNAPWLGSLDEKYGTILVNNFGVKRTNIPTSEEEWLSLFRNGGAAVLRIPGHYICTVGAVSSSETGTGELWLHIVDSSCGSTFKRLTAAGACAYGFVGHDMITSSNGNGFWRGDEYYISLSSYRLANMSVVGAYLPSTYQPDTEKPSISNIQVSNISSLGYTVTCDVSDNVGVTSVKFPTWTQPNDQDDLIWHDGTLSGGRATYTVRISEHNNENGCQYFTHIYAYDAAGNSSSADAFAPYVPSSDLPGMPEIAIQAGTDYLETVISWNATENTTHYDVYMMDGDGNYLYNPTHYRQQTADKRKFAALLNAGNYQVEVFSVNTNNGTFTGSGRIPFTVTSASAPSPIPHKYETEENHELYRVYQKSCTWLEAKQLAKLSKGMLVEINNSNEQAAVAQLVKKLGSRCWIGAERYHYGEWRWCSGSTLSYANWSSGEPNNYDGVETCAEMLTDGKWNDVHNCNSEIGGYVLEFPPQKLSISLKDSYYESDHTFTMSDLDVKVVFNDGTTLQTDKYTFTVSGGKDEDKTITVKYGDLSKKITAHTHIPVTGVSLNKTSISLNVGGSGTLTATVSPGNATNKNVTWSSSDPDVASVSNGTVTAKAAGKATITVKTADGGKTTTCAVTVSVPVAGVKLNKSSLSLNVGGTAKLTATVSPGNATNKNVSWSSSDPNVATVSNGTVTAKSAGKATITVKTANGGKTATCAVTVSVPVTGVTLDKTSLSLNVGGTAKLTATVSPDNATNKSVTWSSSDPNVVAVSDGIVTAIAAGKATITVNTTDGGKTAACAVTVSVPVTGVTLDKKGTIKLYLGKKLKLNATVQPEEAQSKLKWQSSNKEIATVNANGLVTPIKAGTVKITVRTVTGNKKATVIVKVIDPHAPTRVSIVQGKSISVKLSDKKLQLKAKVKAISTPKTKLTWKSSNTKIATVNKKGLVKFKKKGKVTISVTTSNGKKAKIKIRIK